MVAQPATTSLLQENARLKKQVAFYQQTDQAQKQVIQDQRSQIEWEDQLFANPHLSATRKLVLREARRLFASHTLDERGFTRAYLPIIAKPTGLSEQTVGRELQYLAEIAPVLQHKVEHHTNEQGQRITRVYIAPTSLLDTPAAIKPITPNNHGGTRLACPACGCEKRKVTKIVQCADCGHVLHHNEKIVDPGEDDSEQENTGYQDGGRLEMVEVEAIPQPQPPAIKMVDGGQPAINLTDITYSHTAVSVDDRVSALDELRSLPQWVCWRYEKKDKASGKPTKVPYNANPRANNARAKSNDATTWASYEQAQSTYEQSQKWARPYSGIGFVFDGNLVGIDVDHCIDPDTGELSGRLQEITAGVVSYAEISPSGTGVHIIARGSIPANRRREGVEMYSCGQFFTITGKHLPGTPDTIEDCQTAIYQLYAELTPPTKARGRDTNVVYMPSQLSDNEVIEKAQKCEKTGAKFTALWSGCAAGYGSQSEADQALCNYLAYWTGKDEAAIDRLFRQSGLMRDKWDRNARAGETYGEGTIRLAIAS